VVDGEIVKLDETGRPQFYDLMRRRGSVSFVAFDVLVVNGSSPPMGVIRFRISRKSWVEREAVEPVGR
jgi:hypothetical protein